MNHTKSSSALCIFSWCNSGIVSSLAGSFSLLGVVLCFVRCWAASACHSVERAMLLLHIFIPWEYLLRLCQIFSAGKKWPLVKLCWHVLCLSASKAFCYILVRVGGTQWAVWSWVLLVLSNHSEYTMLHSHPEEGFSFSHQCGFACSSLSFLCAPKHLGCHVICSWYMSHMNHLIGWFWFSLFPWGVEHLRLKGC